MILSRPVKRPIGPSADQQATLRVDSQQSLSAVRAVFRAWSNPAVLLDNEMDVVLLIGFWHEGGCCDKLVREIVTAGRPVSEPAE